MACVRVQKNGRLARGKLVLGEGLGVDERLDERVEHGKLELDEQGSQDDAFDL